MAQKQKVYCSGPLFSPEERAIMLSIANTLELAGFATFLPQRDGIESLVMGFVNSPLNFDLFRVRDIIDQAIFALDIYQIIVGCDALVFNMNGRVPDDGALVETAVAWMASKPLVIYKDDVRTVFNGKDNSMITGLVQTKVVERIEDIPTELKTAEKKLLPAGGEQSPSKYPAHVEKAIDRGRLIANLFATMHIGGIGKPNRIIAELAKIIASG